MDSFVAGLQDVGYVEGQTIAVDWRFADYGAAAYPVETGLVASLARPEAGNLTAIAVGEPGVTVKMFELLREVLPGLARVVALVNVTTPVYDVIYWNELTTAADQVGVRVERIDIRSPDDLEDALSRVARSHPDAMICAQNPLLFGVRDRLAELTLQHRIATTAESRDYIQSGVLMGYFTNLGAVFRRAGPYVDKLLKGVKPTDLPVDQPTVRDLVVNARTAQTLGLTIPPSVATLVSEWIQ